MSLRSKAINAFRERYHKSPEFLIRAPGRVNLIGEHTDYNDGFVLPMAIDRAVWVALCPNEDERVTLHSLEKTDPTDFSLNDIRPDFGHWSEYVKGMAAMLLESGYILSGWEGVLTSDVPVGSGLSSSAALEMAVGCAFATVSQFAFDRTKMARLGQRTENEWVGANTGIMDQMISASGVGGHALLIDCRDLSIEAIPIPNETAILVMDTMTRHNHTDSGYNERRESCERAADVLGVSHLRDVSYEQFEVNSSKLDPLTRRRAKHVITENRRVLDSVEAMKAGDARRLGGLLKAGHDSLHNDFEVTNDALDTMVRIAQVQPGCFGARMTGGGFGGCAMALVQSEKAEEMVSIVTRRYEAATKIKPDVFITNATDGVSVIR